MVVIANVTIDKWDIELKESEGDLNFDVLTSSSHPILLTLGVTFLREERPDISLMQTFHWQLSSAQFAILAMSK
ncbi:hypothetical protein A2415_02660 [candidate division WWE3 bacterium RIFOXYC1_FULL_39_7]|uniref:Uncharacterized protein n=2 Tax=Katanobacteria TaxID=422282 RepID=A0A1F4X4K2_UNCKA|nr:MAG: hypothetical protein A2415_02660 [candidate division WWE3 bacterium RIFOXYC1_FULL_39_7]OGC76644.1 MAG: hypothetical protein A2619_04320 [candidate division WWE3 bacterium RIFOXYD1_FULL_39_9]